MEYGDGVAVRHADYLALERLGPGARCPDDEAEEDEKRWVEAG
jgi:hypothetical protein